MGRLSLRNVHRISQGKGRILHSSGCLHPSHRWHPRWVEIIIIIIIVRRGQGKGITNYCLSIGTMTPLEKSSGWPLSPYWPSQPNNSGSRVLEARAVAPIGCVWESFGEVFKNRKTKLPSPRVQNGPGAGCAYALPRQVWQRHCPGPRAQLLLLCSLQESRDQEGIRVGGLVSYSSLSETKDSLSHSNTALLPPFYYSFPLIIFGISPLTTFFSVSTDLLEQLLLKYRLPLLLGHDPRCSFLSVSPTLSVALFCLQNISFNKITTSHQTVNIAKLNVMVVNTNVVFSLP